MINRIFPDDTQNLFKHKQEPVVFLINLLPEPFCKAFLRIIYILHKSSEIAGTHQCVRFDLKVLILLYKSV